MKWQEPPARQHGAKRLISDSALAALKKRPKKWALVKQAKRTANRSITLWGKRFPGYEFTSRLTRKGCDIYARYVGRIR